MLPIVHALYSCALRTQARGKRKYIMRFEIRYFFLEIGLISNLITYFHFLTEQGDIFFHEIELFSNRVLLGMEYPSTILNRPKLPSIGLSVKNGSKNRFWNLTFSTINNLYWKSQHSFLKGLGSVLENSAQLKLKLSLTKIHSGLFVFYTGKADNMEIYKKSWGWAGQSSVIIGVWMYIT